MQVVFFHDFSYHLCPVIASPPILSWVNSQPFSATIVGERQDGSIATDCYIYTHTNCCLRGRTDSTQQKAEEATVTYKLEFQQC